MKFGLCDLKYNIKGKLGRDAIARGEAEDSWLKFGSLSMLVRSVAKHTYHKDYIRAKSRIRSLEKSAFPGYRYGLVARHIFYPIALDQEGKHSARGQHPTREGQFLC